ncbi:MAG: CidA/LrgA family protein [Pseudomonadota bacterium]|nr:CidA/LrgA family protein [Pseudomonadota bacterium]
MIAALAALLLLQLAGEVLVMVTGAPVPGPVVGMVLLYGLLAWRGAVPEALRGTGQTLLGHLSLLFVPAGTGVLLHLRRVAEEWLAIGGALLLSTLLSVAATALVMRWTMRWQERRRG